MGLRKLYTCDNGNSVLKLRARPDDLCVKILWENSKGYQMHAFHYLTPEDVVAMRDALNAWLDWRDDMENEGCRCPRYRPRG